MGHVVRLGTTPGSWPPITRVLGHVSFLPIWQVKSPLGQAVCSLLAHGRAAKVAPLKRSFFVLFCSSYKFEVCLLAWCPCPGKLLKIIHSRLVLHSSART